jgi:hypothetical protein
MQAGSQQQHVPSCAHMPSNDGQCSCKTYMPTSQHYLAAGSTAQKLLAVIVELKAESLQLPQQCRSDRVTPPVNHHSMSINTACQPAQPVNQNSLSSNSGCQPPQPVNQHSQSSREACRGWCGAIPLLMEVIRPGWGLTHGAVGVCRVACLIICKHLSSCLRLLLLAATATAAAVGSCLFSSLVEGCTCTCAEVVSRHPVPAAVNPSQCSMVGTTLLPCALKEGILYCSCGMSAM